MIFENSKELTMNRSIRNLCILVCCLIALLVVVAGSATAQTFRGIILGTVTDSSGGTVPGATAGKHARIPSSFLFLAWLASKATKPASSSKSSRVKRKIRTLAGLRHNTQTARQIIVSKGILNQLAFALVQFQRDGLISA